MGSSNSSSIIVGGNNLVVDFTVSTTAANTFQEGKNSVTSKISFASSTRQTSQFLIESIERKLSCLLFCNNFQELKNIFQFLQLLDSENSIGTLYSKNYDFLSTLNLEFFSDLDVNLCLSQICWNRIGVLDVCGVAFPRLFYHANLESLYLSGLYPINKEGETPFSSLDCINQWKNNFYSVEISWDDTENAILSFSPPVHVDSSVLERYSVTGLAYDNLLHVEKCQLSSLDRKDEISFWNFKG